MQGSASAPPRAGIHDRSSGPQATNLTPVPPWSADASDPPHDNMAPGCAASTVLGRPQRRNRCPRAISRRLRADVPTLTMSWKQRFHHDLSIGPR